MGTDSWSQDRDRSMSDLHLALQAAGLDPSCGGIVLVALYARDDRGTAVEFRAWMRHDVDTEAALLLAQHALRDARAELDRR